MATSAVRLSSISADSAKSRGGPKTRHRHHHTRLGDFVGNSRCHHNRPEMQIRTARESWRSWRAYCKQGWRHTATDIYQRTEFQHNAGLDFVATNRPHPTLRVTWHVVCGELQFNIMLWTFAAAGLTYHGRRITRRGRW